VIKIKKIFITLLFIIFCCTSNSLAITDSLIGTIGNKPLTESDIISEMKMLLIINGQTITKEQEKELQAVALQQITKRLIKQTEIEKYNIANFDELAANAEIKKIANKLNISVDNLKASFRSNEISYSRLTNLIETELKWNSLIFELYKNRISIDINEINEQLEIIQSQNFVEEYHIYEILLDMVPDEELKNKVNWINKEIEINGFEKTASKYSKSNSAINAGALGWLKETMINETLRKILRNTKIGSITKPIISPEGIVLLKLTNKRKIQKKIDLENEKKLLLKAEKEKKLNLYSVSHYNKLKQSTLINFKSK